MWENTPQGITMHSVPLYTSTTAAYSVEYFIKFATLFSANLYLKNYD
jgi:hypothetical protein